MDFSKIKTYSLSKRKSKIDKTLFAKPLKSGSGISGFLASLPNILKAKELNSLISAVVSARKKKKPVMLFMGAHVIKCGLSPVIIDMIESGIFTSVSFNGAGIIHDFEISFNGATSEDVASALEDGSFGMAHETAYYLNNAISDGVKKGLGLGESIGSMIDSNNFKYKKLSIAGTCFKKKIPFTVHVAIGTDIIHQHPSANGADIGEATMMDFKTVCQQVAGLNDGGVVINFGSAVVLPEVFLKSLSVARNLTKRVSNFTTANFDMNFHYRPMQNIVLRPVLGAGRGYYIVGHHEIMLPLLAAALKEKLS